jgi:lysozyme family protein
MESSYREVMKHIRYSEGGYSNHPKDPGKATMAGVTQAVYNSYRNNKGQFNREVRLITEDEIADIYRTRYWNKICGDQLPAGVDYAVMDAGVNSGVSRAGEWLQQSINDLIPQGKITVDKDIGPTTIRMARACDPAKLVNRICDRRLSTIRGFTSLWKTFGGGWTNRIEGEKDSKGIRRGGVRQWAIAMTTKSAISEPGKPVSPPLAPDTQGKKETSPLAILVAILGAAAFAVWRYFNG